MLFFQGIFSYITNKRNKIYGTQNIRLLLIDTFICNFFIRKVILSHHINYHAQKIFLLKSTSFEKVKKS